jgi:mono/diheme cytochrome c family protein
MKGRAALLIGGLLLPALLATTSNAAEQAASGDSVRGRHLALAWCSNCHALDGEIRRSGDTPDFTAIARKPSTSAASLRAFLQTAHAGMPDWQLTRDEIEDLIAYILSLKK